MAERPTTSDLKSLLKKENERLAYGSTLRSTIYILIIVAAFAILISTLVLPMFRIYGSSMTPTLHEGDIVAAVRSTEFKHGDLIAFYYNNKLLVKRVIAMPGEWVDIDQQGYVYVNNVRLVEPYVDDFSYDDCTIELPYQVPENRIFVMGDHRSSSIDSRVQEIGCISEDLIAGKLIVRIWPLGQISLYQ